VKKAVSRSCISLLSCMLDVAMAAGLMPLCLVVISTFTAYTLHTRTMVGLVGSRRHMRNRMH
jgi:hypothetical protein